MLDSVSTYSRASAMKLLHERLQISIAPAIQSALAGYDVIVADGSSTFSQSLIQRNRASQRRKEYTRNAVFVLQSIVHLLAVAQAFAKPPDDVFVNNFKSLVLLGVKVAEAAKISHDHLYGNLITTGPTPNSAPRFFGTMLERARRAFWGMVIIDNIHSAMHRWFQILNGAIAKGSDPP